MRNLAIISYRCPTSHSTSSTELSTGGLVSSIHSLKSKFNIHWFCFDSVSTRDTHNNLIVDRIGLDKELNEKYYGKYCNTYIWPLFHYISNTESFEFENWQSYVNANLIMADAISYKIPHDQFIIVNDYHLSLLPKYLKDRGFNKIGFFWHIPWVKYEYISRIPNLDQIVSGILGADVIGFHTEGYKKNFIETVNALNINSNDLNNRIRAVPIGLDVDMYRQDKKKISQNKFNIELRKMRKNKIRIIGSVSRLDMTKGIIQAINGFRRFLEKNPNIISKITYIMVISPSRISITEYGELKKKIDQLVGNVNSAFRTVSWTPILYIYRKIPQVDLISLMRNSDLFLITPIMDGLNLVAEEYILLNDSGIPIISKFAGISEYLKEAPIINPFDPEQISNTIYEVLNEDKRKIFEKNKLLKKRVKELDINNWISKMML